MFGTLVIQLPSDYDGGELRVRHRDEEQIFDFSGLHGITNYNYATFYADCEHELCEVTRGYRLCLVYNLVYSGDDACPVPIDNSEVVAKVVEDMRKWEQDDDGLPYMAYVLDHNYCKASLSFGLLKNGDRAKAEVILEAEKQVKFCLYLGTVTLEQGCSLEQGYSMSDYGNYGYGCSREDYDVEDIINESLTVDTLVSSTGDFLDDSIYIELTHDAIVPGDVFDSIDPAEEDFEPYTGNAGATLDRTYHQGALFIWPRKNTILVTGSIKEAINSLNSKLCQSEDSQQLQGECEELAKEIIAVCKNSEFCPNNQDMISLLSCLKRLKAIVLVCELFKAIAIHNLQLLRHQPFCEAVVELGNAFGWEQLEEGLVALFEGAIARKIYRACNFLSSLASGSLSQQRLKVCQKMVDVICHVITNEQDIVHRNPQGLARKTTQRARSKDFVCELFKTLCSLQSEDQLGVVIQSFFRQPKRYSLHHTLVPAAIELQQTMKENCSCSTALSSFVSQCVSALEHRTQQAPTWLVQANLKCHCELCTELAAFLKDPQRSVARYSTKQCNRSHLEQQLKNCRIAVSCTTEYHGVPYTLVVTKNDNRFKAYRNRLALLDRIRPLLDQDKPPVKRQKLEDDSCMVIE